MHSLYFMYYVLCTVYSVLSNKDLLSTDCQKPPLKMKTNCPYLESNTTNYRNALQIKAGVEP